MRDFWFPATTAEFLGGIAAHNDKAWFEANRALYQAGYVEAAADFVSVLGPELQQMSPEVQYAPKVNGSISRVNRDVRFSKDKRPYKDHLDLWFWHGAKRGWDRPGFFFRLTATEVIVGAGWHGFDKEALDRFRAAVVDDRSGGALLDAVAAVSGKAGLTVGEQTRKRPPRGYETDAERTPFLLFEGLVARADLPAEAAYQPGFAARCLAIFAAGLPIVDWLNAEVVA